jgi:hypothetical protein
MIKRFCFLWLWVMLSLAGSVTGEESTDSGAVNEGRAPLESEINALKREALALQHDLARLEDELLFPSSSQLSVFLSLDASENFTLTAVKLSIDERIVASSLYDPAQREALASGAVQPLYVGNLRKGAHQITAELIGTDRSGRKYQNDLAVDVVKRDASSALELRIVGSRRGKPQFRVNKQWAL